MAAVRENRQAEPPKQRPEQLPPADKARQGVTGHGVRFVLLYSLLGVISAFMLLALYWAV